MSKYTEPCKLLLESIDGEDVKREGLLKTPERMAKSFDFLLSGYNTSDEVLQGIKDAVFKADVIEGGTIIVKDINTFSLCEHHVLPFYGITHIGYIPNDNKILGLSKVARIVDIFSRRLQVQERLTQQIGQFLDEILSPKGVIVMMQAEHLCMAMRGVQKVGSSTNTLYVSGVFKDNKELEGEFVSRLKL